MLLLVVLALLLLSLMLLSLQRARVARAKRKRRALYLPRAPRAEDSSPLVQRARAAEQRVLRSLRKREAHVTAKRAKLSQAMA